MEYGCLPVANIEENSYSTSWYRWWHKQLKWMVSLFFFFFLKNGCSYPPEAKVIAWISWALRVLTGLGGRVGLSPLNTLWMVWGSWFGGFDWRLIKVRLTCVTHPSARMREKESLHDISHLQNLPHHRGVINMRITILKHYKKASISNHTREEENPALLFYVNKVLAIIF